MAAPPLLAGGNEPGSGGGSGGSGGVAGSGGSGQPDNGTNASECVRLRMYFVKRHKAMKKTGLRSRAGGRITLILSNNLTTRSLVFRYRPFVRGTAVAGRQTLHIKVVR